MTKERTTESAVEEPRVTHATACDSPKNVSTAKYSHNDEQHAVCDQVRALFALGFATGAGPAATAGSRLMRDESAEEEVEGTATAFKISALIRSEISFFVVSFEIFRTA